MDSAVINDGENVDINDSKTKAAFNTSIISVNNHTNTTGKITSNNVFSSGHLSSLSSSSSEEVTASVQAAPDGGWGWVVVFASFMVNFIADGVSLSFGILFVELVQYFGESKAKTSWVGSIFLSMPLLAGPIASYLTDRYGCQKICIAGGLLTACAFAMSIFANSLEILFLTFSIGGLGLALCCVTSIVIIAYYFEKKRSLATGLAACGTGIGTFVFPPLTIYLLDEYEWQGALLILSGFFLNLVAFGALMRDLDFPVKTMNSDEKHASDDNSSSHENLTLEDSERLCSSLVQLPTYLRDNLPFEVINELSHKEGGHLNSLLEQHPSFFSSGVVSNVHGSSVTSPSDVRFVSKKGKTKLKQNTAESKGKERHHCQSAKESSSAPKLDSSYLRNLRLQRGSITYRGAMLNTRRYRLRASSCPDIYRNSMVTISDEKSCLFLADLKELLYDMFDLSIFKNLQYTLFCVSNFILYACVDVPYVYIPDHANNQGVDMESASFLISVLGILNTLGVVIVGYIGDKPWIDSSLLYSGFITISGIMLGVIPLIKDYYGLATVVGIYGFMISANYTLVSVMIVNLISLDHFTGAYGLLLLVQGIASLVGPPVAGLLFDVTGNYDITFYCTGVCIFVSGILVIPMVKTFCCRRSFSSVSSKEYIKPNSHEEKVKFSDSNASSIEAGRKLYDQSKKLRGSLCFDAIKNNEACVIVPLICDENGVTNKVTESSSLVKDTKNGKISIYENPISKLDN